MKHSFSINRVELTETEAYSTPSGRTAATGRGKGLTRAVYVAEPMEPMARHRSFFVGETATEALRRVDGYTRTTETTHTDEKTGKVTHYTRSIKLGGLAHVHIANRAELEATRNAETREACGVNYQTLKRAEQKARKARKVFDVVHIGEEIWEAIAA